MFKLMHWPSASMLIVLGFTLSIPSFIIYLIVRYKDKEKARLATYGAYIFVVFLGIGLTVFEGIKATKNILNGFIDISKSSELISTSLSDLVSDVKFDKYKGVRFNTQQLIKTIQQNKLYLIEMSGGSDQNGRPLGKDNQDIAAQFFLVDNGGENGLLLAEKINELHASYVLLFEGEADRVQFNTASAVTNVYGGVESWSSVTFEHVPLATSLAKLSTIQAAILSSELSLYTYLEEKGR